MAFTRTGTVSHDTLSGVSTADHHTATVAGDLNLADLAARAHGDLSDAPADSHHAGGHTVVSHSDTGATGAEADTLTDGSNADTLHVHDAGLTTKVIAGSRSAAAGAGDQSITGFGFDPVGGIILAVLNTDESFSVGFFDSAGGEFCYNNLESAVALDHVIQTVNVINITDGTNKMVVGTLVLISDGVTLTWTKTSAGMAVTFNILAFR